MATVESWFRNFLERHLERIPRDDWSPPESSYWDAFQKSITRHGITEFVADSASELMAERESVFPDKHLAAFLATVKEVWKASVVATAGEGGSRESAEAGSRDCRDCGGHGLAWRYRHGEPKRGQAECLTLYCLCAMGRWLENNHRTGDEKAREVHRRMPDLADHRFLQCKPVPWSEEPENRHCYRREMWDADLDRPKVLIIESTPKTASLHRMLKRADDAQAEQRYAEVAAF